MVLLSGGMYCKTSGEITAGSESCMYTVLFSLFCFFFCCCCCYYCWCVSVSVCVCIKAYGL